MVVIEALQAADLPDVLRILGEGIATGVATLETATPDAQEWEAKHLQKARLVARDGRMVVGWAALSPYSSRAVRASASPVTRAPGPT